MCASSSTRTICGRRAMMASRSISSSERPLYSTCGGERSRAPVAEPSSPSAVGLDNADDDVVAVLLAGARRLQHLVGLADARRRADENPELARVLPRAGRLPAALRATVALRSSLLARPCSLWPPTSAGPIICAAMRSRARLSANTLTRGSPRSAEQAAFDVALDQLAHLLLGKLARLGDARHLEECGFRRDMRIETAARRGDEIDRNRSRRVFLPSASRRRPSRDR